jgi:methylated-DNA-[protein]-cysteine S-methyltransferase
VIASNGELKGYAWGLHRKRWLLEHEKAIQTPSAPTASRAAARFLNFYDEPHRRIPVTRP